MWYGSAIYQHFGQRVIFLLSGAKETHPPGSALFPEILSELHGVRSVI
jgi:hypothetical protein